MVALATAFVRIAPETTAFKSEAEKLLGAAGVSAGKKMGDTAGSSAAKAFKSSGKELVKVGEEHGGETGKKFKEKFIEVISVKELAAKLSGIFTVAAGVEMFRGFIDAAREATRYTQLTEAVLKSTGEQAHVSAKAVEEMATQLGAVIGVDKGVIISGENLMLTFRTVRNEVGKGNDIFDRGTKAALDMTAALNHGDINTSNLKNSTIALGKALGSPLEGFKALRRVGIVFSEDQKNQIKLMVKNGDIMGAQKVILKEIETEFGGAAKASADPVRAMSEQWNLFQETVGLKMVPLLNKFLAWLNGGVIAKTLEFGRSMAVGVVPVAERVGHVLVGLVPILLGLVRAFVSLAQTMVNECTPAFKLLVGGALVGMVVAVLAAIKAVTGLLNIMSGGSTLAVTLRIAIYTVVGAMIAWKVATLIGAAATRIHTAAIWLGVAAQREEKMATLGSAIASKVYGLTTVWTGVQVAALTIAEKAHAAATWVATGATKAWGVAMTLFNVKLWPTIAGLAALKVAQVAGAVWTGVVTAAQWAWNIAMDANPIGLVVLAIAALVGALILAWQHSKTFRDVVMAMWDGIKTASKWTYENVLKPVFAGIMLYIKLGIAVFKIYWAVAKEMWSVISTAAKWTYENVLHPIFTGIMAYIHLGIAVFKIYWEVVKAGWAVISFAISVAWHVIIQPIWLLMRIGVMILIASFILLWRGIKQAWDLIGAGIRVTWRTVIKPVWDLIVAGIRILNTISLWLNVQLKKIWKDIGALIKLAWTAVIKPIWDLLVAGIRYVGKVFAQFWKDLKLVWDQVVNMFKTVWNSGIKPIFDAVNSGIGMVGRAFATGASAIGVAWSKIKDLTKAPVNFVIGTVFNTGIIGLWNKVIGWLHLTGMTLNPLPLLESGGRVPGGKYNRATAIVGEGNPQYPEYVIPTDPKYRSRAAMLWQAAGGDLSMLEGGGQVQMMQLGGILGTIGKIASKITSIGSAAINLIANPGKVIGDLFKLIPGLSDPGGVSWQHAIASVPPMIINKATTFIESVVGAFGANFGGGSGNGTKAVQYAIAQLGKPYQWGATGPATFDCSGLTMRAWEAAGKNIGRTTFDQVKSGSPGDRSKALPGDLHFPDPGHVMMFVTPRSGNATEMINAPHTGANVRYDSFRGAGVVRLIASLIGGAGVGGSTAGGGGASAQAAQAFAQAQFGQFGWNSAQMGPLIQLWNQESGWRWNARNPSSGAYGIPQSLPANKMASAGADWLTNAFTQVRWGLGYIKGRYGSPSGAEAHERAFNWYDKGGILPPGGVGFNTGPSPERVLTDQQWSDIATLARRGAGAGAGPSIGPINVTGVPDIPSENQIANAVDRVLTMHGSHWR